MLDKVINMHEIFDGRYICLLKLLFEQQHRIGELPSNV